MGPSCNLTSAKMFLLISCLAVTSLAWCKTGCLTLVTKANDTCIFPFTYNGVEYYRCTYADSPTPWCATMVDPNNTVVTNRWGDCSTSQFSNCPEDTPDLPSCTAESGASCVFPFRHEGITYNSCASTDLLSSAW